jgi:hypothetical protein
MKEPIDYLLNIMFWTMITPMMLTHDSQKKWVRISGKIMCIPFVLTWYFTVMPFLLCCLVLLVAQIFWD